VLSVSSPLTGERIKVRGIASIGLKIPLTCSRCALADKSNHVQVYPAAVRDDGLYEFTCPRGHKNIISTIEMKFEVLFEIGVYAILDSYYREAVSSFTSALERLYEVYISVICIKHGVPIKVYSDAWKSVSNQSERQFGAFLFLYLREHGWMPPLLVNGEVEFRNAVIHKGRIPTKEEAVNYGDKVLKVISPIFADLKVNYETHIREARCRLRRELNKHIPQDTTESGLGMPGVLKLTTEHPQSYPLDLQRYLCELEERRKRRKW
jgi:hypothetical protein